MKIIKSITIFLFLYKSMISQQTTDSVPNHETFTIQSVSLNELRTINVWLPTTYNSSLDSFPVMYMADGGIIEEDFPHVANTMALLISQKQIPPMILVGIQNTQRRRDLTGPTEVESDKKIAPVVGGSEQFRLFIKSELFPEIEKRYKTTSKKGILGESLSGLFVMETFFKEPEMFDYYIAFDPSLWWNNHTLVNHANTYLQKLPNKLITLWFAGSSAKDIYKYTRQLNRELNKANYSSLRFFYSDEPKEKHHTIFRATKEKALKWVFEHK